MSMVSRKEGGASDKEEMVSRNHLEASLQAMFPRPMQLSNYLQRYQLIIGVKQTVSILQVRQWQNWRRVRDVPN